MRSQMSQGKWQHQQNAPLREGKANAMVNNVSFLPCFFQLSLIAMHLWTDLQAGVFKGRVTKAESKLKAWCNSGLKSAQK